MPPSDFRSSPLLSPNLMMGLAPPPPPPSPLQHFQQDEQHQQQQQQHQHQHHQRQQQQHPSVWVSSAPSFPAACSNPTTVSTAAFYQQLASPQLRISNHHHSNHNHDPGKKSVRFDSVTIHCHTIDLGDNPSVSIGPAIALSWERAEDCSQCYSLSLYEAARFARRRTLEQMRIPPSYRILALKRAGISESEIQKAILCQQQQQQQKQQPSCKTRRSSQGGRRDRDTVDAEDDDDGESDDDLLAVGPRTRRHIKPKLLEWFQAKRQRTTKDTLITRPRK